MTESKRKVRINWMICNFVEIVEKFIKLVSKKWMNVLLSNVLVFKIFHMLMFVTDQSYPHV